MESQLDKANKPLFNNSHDLLLHETCALGDDTKLEELGSFLRSGKIDIDSRDEEWGERTAIHWAALRGHAKCVKLLLEYGADSTARMVGGWTPAHCAAEAGRLNVLRALVDHQAAVVLPDNTGDTPKRVAEIYGNTACVELLESVEQSAIQKQLLIRDKFRSNARKISHILSQRNESNPKSIANSVAASLVAEEAT